MKDLRSLFKNRDCQKWIGLKQKDGKYIIQKHQKKQVEMAILINKIDFRTMNIVTGTLHEQKITK